MKKYISTRARTYYNVSEEYRPLYELVDDLTPEKPDDAAKLISTVVVGVDAADQEVVWFWEVECD